MRQRLLFLFFCSIHLFAQGQINVNSQWIWVKGGSMQNEAGIYGAKGLEAVPNTPGAREGSVSWTDKTGHLWLFAGRDAIGVFNDLWKFNPGTNQWTWVKGDNTQGVAGIYGTQGVGASGNQPGARFYSTSWIDLNGNFWLFGGSAGSGYFNDLWKYDPSTDQWTWMKGDNLQNVGGSYGIRGVAANANKPGARFSAASWTDASGILWLFGGRGHIATGSGLTNLNDLWKYDPSSNQWTWISGDNSGNGAGVYGTKGVPSLSNKPSGRFGSSSWMDATGGFWLFGGQQYFPLSSVFNSYNDLWKFDLITNQWTWVSGDNTANNTGVYGLQGMEDPSNKPGARYNAASWSDSYGNLWLFGGQFFYTNFGGTLGAQDEYNDLWKFNISSNQWTWVNGNSAVNVYGVYGTQNVAASTNKPGARLCAVSWIDDAGQLWLFGGNGFAASGIGYLNDLWKLSSRNTLPVTFVGITATLEGNVVTVNWQTASENNTSHFVVERSADGQLFSAIGFLKAAGNSISTTQYTYPDPHPYQQVNFYRIKIVDRDGSFAYSNVVNVKVGAFNDHVTILPNPVRNNATIKLSTFADAELKLYLYDGKGQLLRTKEVSVRRGINSIMIDMSRFSNGVYFAVMKWGKTTKYLQVVKE